MLRRSTPIVSILVTLVAPAAVQAQAEGIFPGTLSCDASTTGPTRIPVTVTVAGGRATYRFAIEGPGGAKGAETGTGTLAPDRRLVLSGQGKGNGFAYTARYAGEIGGRGGLLAGTQTWTIAGKSQSRACQLVLGNG